MKVLVAGAAPDTNNLGVSALLMSTVYGVLSVFPSAQFYVLDNGTGVRETQFSVGNRDSVDINLVGVRSGKKLYHSGNLHLLKKLVELRLPRLFWPETLKVISNADVVLDISGGDSFSDIYGAKRFFEITVIKQMVKKLGLPMLLLPQTYGPYQDPKNKKIAKEIVRNADIAMARDANSFLILQNLLGGEFKESKHFSGVDVAFSLPLRKPDSLPQPLYESLMLNRDNNKFKIGINISGLVYQDKDRAITAFGFIADYNQLLADFVNWILEDTEADIFLIPHVMEPEGHYESDWGGSKKFLEENDLQFNERITLLPRTLECDEVKWVISKLDWFCGMRMHSTIAGLSTCVPTTSIAYSDKTLGVFESCGQENQVFDPRKQNNEEILAALISSVNKRTDTKQQLNVQIPKVISKSADQFVLVSNFLKKKT